MRARNRRFMTLLVVGLLALLAVSLLWLFRDAGTPRDAEVTWRSASDAEMERALDDGKVIAVRYVADWSPAATVYEQEVFAASEVTQLLSGERIACYRVDVTAGMPTNLKLLAPAGTVHVPAIVIIPPEHRSNPMILQGKFNSADVADALSAALGA